MQDVSRLPKAHLHLHLTGGMRPATLVELAAEQGRVLPPELLDPVAVDVTVRRGWYRFQRLYDAAREVLRGPAEVQRVVREIVEDQRAAGVGWLELQVDPSTYAPRCGGLVATVELVLDALRGFPAGLVVAANRTRHPGDAETLARVAARFAGRGVVGGVVGFGLSNDETRGETPTFAKAFRIARQAGLAGVPHAGELRGPGSVRAAVEHLHAVRLGHGVRAVEDPEVLDLLAERRVVCEVCPASNVALSVYGSLEEVPVQRLRAAGVRVALGADDPLLFRSGLLEQYAPYPPQEQAALARDSITGSLAPDDVKADLLRGVDAWLARPPG